MERPDWLTADYISETLCCFLKDDALQIREIDFKPALGKGENFGGILTRAQVTYITSQQQKSIETKNLLVKSSFENDEFSKAKMEPYDIFNREISIYENVLPKINELLHEMNDNDALFPTVLRIDYEHQALVFEDLSVKGYIMVDRVKRLDLAHVKLILRKIAKMHAISAVLNERTNGSLESYDRGFFNRYTDNYSTYFVGTLLACAEYLGNTSNLKSFSKKLYELAPHYMEIGKRCFAPKSDQINVFAHGDLWTNNVMFRYESGKPQDVLLIDFQYSFWGSPTLDLHHFFNTSIKEHLRLRAQDLLVQYYYDIFSEVLRKLNYRKHPIPSLRLFRLHMEEKRFFGFHSACVIQPVMINEDSTDADFNALMNTDERSLNFKRRLFNNPQVQDNLEKLLPFFDQRGLLDIDQSD